MSGSSVAYGRANWRAAGQTGRQTHAEAAGRDPGPAPHLWCAAGLPAPLGRAHYLRAACFGATN